MALLTAAEEAKRLYELTRSQLMDVVKAEELKEAVKACCSISVELARRSGDIKFWDQVRIELGKI